MQVCRSTNVESLLRNYPINPLYQVFLEEEKNEAIGKIGSKIIGQGRKAKSGTSARQTL